MCACPRNSSAVGCGLLVASCASFMHPLYPPVPLPACQPVPPHAHRPCLPARCLQGPAAGREEIGGYAGPEPTRYSDWEIKGRCSDF